MVILKRRRKRRVETTPFVLRDVTLDADYNFKESKRHKKKLKSKVRFKLLEEHAYVINISSVRFLRTSYPFIHDALLPCVAGARK